MANTDLGKAGITANGAWSASASYEENCIVSNDGKSYLSRKPVPAGTALTNTEYWQLLVEGGGGATVYVQTTEPSNPSEGDIWCDPDEAATPIPTKVSDLTNDSGFLTLGTLPIYDGTVI